MLPVSHPIEFEPTEFAPTEFAPLKSFLNFLNNFEFTSVFFELAPRSMDERSRNKHVLCEVVSLFPLIWGELDS